MLVKANIAKISLVFMLSIYFLNKNLILFLYKITIDIFSIS